MKAIPLDFKLVTGAGAGGGFVSWAYSLMTGTTFGMSYALALPCYVILGAAAAIFSVYIITPTDTSKVARLIAWAVLCGFMWKPVFDSVKIVFNERLQLASHHREAETAIDALQQPTAPSAAPERIEAAKDTVNDLLQSSNTLGSPQLEKQASEKAADVVEAIAAKADANPDAAKDAIKDIEQTAVETGNHQLAQLARAKLATIPDTTAPPPETTATTGTTATTTT